MTTTFPSAFWFGKASCQRVLKNCEKERNSSRCGIDGNSYVVYKSRGGKYFVNYFALFGEVWGLKLLYTSMVKTSGKKVFSSWTPETNFNFEHWRDTLFSLVEKRLSDYMIPNGYIKRWQKNAFMVDIASCIEHSTLIFEALQEAKKEYWSISLAILDFANANGLIRLNFIHFKFAMEWDHFSPWLCKLIFCY